MERKIEKLSITHAKTTEEQEKVEFRFYELKQEINKYSQLLPSQQDEHNKVMYDTKCRKMELTLKRRER